MKIHEPDNLDIQAIYDPDNQTTLEPAAVLLLGEGPDDHVDLRPLLKQSEAGRRILATLTEEIEEVEAEEAEESARADLAERIEDNEAILRDYGVDIRGIES